jgi:hypothetical protein
MKMPHTHFGSDIFGVWQGWRASAWVMGNDA